jgi:hypothetical protein
MLKKIVAIIFLLGYALTSSAQTITLKGIVKDSLQNPLAYANVIAKPKDVTKNIKFAITDDDGLYKIELTKGNQYTISISYMGYDAVSYQFTADKKTIKNFILKEAKNQLNEVIIEMPVVVKQDTIIYNTKKFVNGTERKLKNVLKKLPGVEVDKNGGITVNGKKVTKMLVEGKTFFGGGTKLAVDNIPADAIDKVEVIDNYNEVAFLKNVSDSDEMAMNIKLKKDKKNFMFGDMEAGKGNQKYYRTHANLFYYSPKTNVNFIGNRNNTGEKTFTFKDYMNFQGGINAVFSGNFKWKNSDFTQFLNSNDILSSKNKFAALNITKVTTNKLDVSGFAIISKTDTHSFEEGSNQYASIIEHKQNTTNAENVFGIGKLNLEYTPNKKAQWYARTQVKKTSNINNNDIFSTINSTQNTFNTNRETDAVFVNQNIEWHQQQSDKHTFSFIADYTFDKNNPTNYWQTTNQILQGLIPVDDSQSTYRIHQNREIVQHNFNTIFKHFWILDNNNHIYTTVGNNISNEKFLTIDKQELDNGSFNNFSSNGFGNDVNFKLNDFYFGLHYKFRTGIFTLKQGVELHNYNWNIHQQTDFSKSKWVALPDFLGKIEFNKSKSIRIRYNLKTNFSNASKLANQFYLRSYNSVFKGNSTLENELFHNASIFYSRFSLYRGLMMSASANYTKKAKGFTNSVVFDETNPDPTQRTNQFLTTQLIDNPSENWLFRGFAHKTIKKIKYKFKGDANLSKYVQNINNQIQNNTNNSYSLEAGIETLFDNFPTIELGYKRTIGKYTAGNSTSNFVRSEPYLNIDYDFLKGFIFNFDYKRSSSQNKSLNQKNVYELANAKLSYKNDDSAWSYKITANNLFNTTFKQSNSFSDYLIRDTKTYILPRIYMFSIAYNL